MKIAMVTPYWFPVLGGPTTFVAQLSTELRARGHEVRVIAAEGARNDATIVAKSGRAFVRRAATILAEFRPDAIHAHAHWYTLAAGLRNARRRPECRVVFTLHTPFPRRSWWRRAAVRLLTSRADFLTAVSGDLLRESLATFGMRVRTRVTYPGIAVKPIVEGERDSFLREFGLAGRNPRIGYLGQLSWPEKVRGLEQLIRAMRSVRAAVPTAQLLVGGEGPLKEGLRELAQQEAPDGVAFLGEVTNASPRFFTATQVYAHISDMEGLPLALLEAMGIGCAVVASAVGGIPEVLRNGDNGFLVSNEPAEIAGRIVQLLRSPELCGQLAQRAQADVATRFASRRAADRFLPMFGASTQHRVVVTVDLERDYSAPPGSARGVREAWPKLSDIFDRHRVRTHVFATSDLTTSFPAQLGEIARRHDLGCHGESHDVEYLSSRSYGWQLAAIRRATEALEGCTGERPRSFRAPNFSANGDTMRALQELGYRYDSSVLPGRVVRKWRVRKVQDFLVAPRDPYRPSREDISLPGDAALWEVPVAENPFSLGGPIGLGFVHAFGVERALEAVAHSVADPCVVLIHPWELLEPPPVGRGPTWMQRACSSDPAKFDEFLRRLREDHEVVTFDDLPELSDSTTPARTLA